MHAHLSVLVVPFILRYGECVSIPESTLHVRELVGYDYDGRYDNAGFSGMRTTTSPINRLCFTSFLTTATVGASIQNIYNGITGEGEQEHADESAWTQAQVIDLQNRYPDSNVLIFHDQNSVFHPDVGFHSHYELDLEGYFGTRTQGYEVWVFNSGTFTHAGDGGYINWAFSGSFDRNDNQVTFHDRKRRYSMFGLRNLWHH